MSNRNIQLINLSIGRPKMMTYADSKQMETGICKKTVNEAFLSKEGFKGDGVANLKHHGGPDRAVCIYPYEHYSLWEKAFNVQLPPSAFGENLTVANMLERDVCIGDTYQVGDAVIQVTQGRMPCSTISKRMNLPSLLDRIIEEGYTGYLCRVIEEGTVRRDSSIRLLKRHSKQVTVLFANQIYFHSQNDIEGMKKIIAVEALASVWRQKLLKRIEKLSVF
ncbi:MOSC domain-containing protein YiiM [Scopulibacillus daqui]|uniref:MOSC domain-containing protein YiiM n=1 Tax=Scopulibacillus daqui TaxID=1469162 RepID=A0ABS2Q303_9BACL|nr:MOSC domain-containing protein [Scopulibacillus daqui]MBM7646200.1 MOSC domain-containing protein YiiM [Scopulibacillus daqui]